MDFPETEDSKWQFHLRVAMRRNTPAVPHRKNTGTRHKYILFIPFERETKVEPSYEVGGKLQVCICNTLWLCTKVYYYTNYEQSTIYKTIYLLEVLHVQTGHNHQGSHESIGFDTIQFWLRWGNNIGKRLNIDGKRKIYKTYTFSNESDGLIFVWLRRKQLSHKCL